jgi:E3 ubiquitin-protein ligase BAH
MKYARQFQDHLKNDGYPPEWINSAISYASLKKCIKRVQRELATLGLDVETLRQLLASVEDGQGGEHNSTIAVATQEDNDDVHEEEDGHRNGSTSTACSNVSDNSKDEQQLPFQYTFSTEHSSPSRRIVPKLLFIVDAETGEPLSANLAPETRNYLHQLAVTEKLTTVRITDETDEDESSINDPLNQQTQRSIRYIQIPLTTDSEFFRLLERELTRLSQLQVAERKKLSNDIHSIGDALSRAANPDSKSQRKDLARWRQLFECYIDAQVFFATNERDHGSRGSNEAAKNFATFLTNARSANLLSGFKTVESAKSLDMFLNFNKELLKCLKFQEINQVAMTKILKSNFPFNPFFYLQLG